MEIFNVVLPYEWYIGGCFSHFVFIHYFIYSLFGLYFFAAVSFNSSWKLFLLLYIMRSCHANHIFIHSFCFYLSIWWIILMIEMLFSIYFEGKTRILGHVWSVSWPSASSSAARTSSERVSCNSNLHGWKVITIIVLKILCCFVSKSLTILISRLWLW